MKMTLSLMARFMALVSALSWLLTGCATTKVDWNSRINNYTFDQAVLDMGPPDKSAKLDGGTMVAEWLAIRGSRGSVQVWGGFGYYHWPGSFWVTDYPPTPDRFIRLTFGPDGKLAAWKRVSK